MRKPNENFTFDGTVFIALGRGLWAMVDESDYPEVAGFYWRAVSGRDKAGRLFYATSGSKHITMHRLVAGGLADHRNGDGLDNRRCNLRPCSVAQNMANRRKASTREYTSRYKGVRFHARHGKFYASIQGKHLGSFTTEVEAARAYDEAARLLMGEFARPNLPGDPAPGPGDQT